MDEVIALLEEEKIEFYNLEGEKIECNNLENYTFYTILPDEYFFFFQTNIESKRKASQTIKAFAKSIFPIEDENFIGYVPFLIPLIGYIFFTHKISEEHARILNLSKITTTPFILHLNAHKDESFIYNGKNVCALYQDRELKYYTISDLCPPEDREQPIDENIIKYSKEDTINLLIEAISSKKIANIHIPTNDEARFSISRSTIIYTSIIFILLFFLMAGDIVKYTYYKKQLDRINIKINNIYEKALGKKHYSDPYGVLLYKANYSSSATYDIDPLKLMYALSKAKGNLNITIDYLSFDSSGSVKISGKASGYDAITNYSKAVSDILSKTFTIQNTSSKNGKLIFTMVYQGSRR